MCAVPSSSNEIGRLKRYLCFPLFKQCNRRTEEVYVCLCVHCRKVLSDPSLVKPQPLLKERISCVDVQSNPAYLIL